MKQQLDEHIEKNNILLQEQSGFKKGHSCETSLQNIISNWKESIDFDLLVGVVFIDFKRAFETINRERLILKLKCYGVDGVVLEWFRSYLNDRYQKTKYGSIISSKEETIHGVPQGSVLGPLLFILYINDIKSSINNCLINLFADDAMLYVYDKNVNTIENYLNADIAAMQNWMSLNKLKVNSNKCKCMLINSKRNSEALNINIYIDNSKLEQVSEIKYLGVIIDNKLNFKAHVQYIIKKVAKKINFLSRISNIISTLAKITVYKSIIAPHFEYCGTILYFINESDIATLQKLQNRAMRIILHCNRYTPIELMLDTLKFMSVKQRICYNTLLFIFKIKEGMFPKYLVDRIQYTRERHDYETRQRDNFYIPFRKKTFTQNYIYYNGLKMFNALPSDIKIIHNLNQFRRHIISYVKCNF